MNTDEQKIYVQIGELKAGIEQMKRERDAALAANTKMALSAVNMAASLDELKAELVNLRSNKDQLLTQDDGDYLRQRLGEMVELEAQRDDLLAALKECEHFIAGMHPDMMDYDTQQKQERAITAARLAIARATTGTTETP